MAEIIELTDEPVEETSFDKLVEQIPGLDGIQALTAILELDDKQFEAMRPIVLEELEKGFNNSNDKYNLALAFNMSGLSTTELRAAFDATIEKIDTEFSAYDEPRRNFLKQVILMMVNSLETGKAAHNRIVRIPIQLCKEGAHIPTYAHDGDAGCDVYSLEDYTIEPNQTALLPLGFKVAIPMGYELQIRPRSGMSSKTKLRIANSPATIDSSYRGEVGVIIDNISSRPCYIVKGQRIAQMVLNEVPAASFYEVDDVSKFETDRAEKGFGSSGV